MTEREKMMSGEWYDANFDIGSHCFIGKDIPAFVVAAGNPCRVLRPLTSPVRDSATN